MHKFVGVWRALAPAIDLIGPDMYSDDLAFYLETLRAITGRIPLFILETGKDDSFAKFFFTRWVMATLVFLLRVDRSGWDILGDQPFKVHANNFALFGPMSREIPTGSTASVIAVEQRSITRRRSILVPAGNRGLRLSPSERAQGPGTKDADGSALVARLGPYEFL